MRRNARHRSPVPAGCSSPDVVTDGLPAPPVHPRRLAFLGTPSIAVPALEALVRGGHDVALVVSRADKRRGRRGSATPSPVKAAALDLGLAVTDSLSEVLETDVDLGVVAAYGRIVPRRVLEAVPMVNLHFSLLPRWRGAAPVERAILAGDAETGVAPRQRGSSEKWRLTIGTASRTRRGTMRP